MLGYDDTVGSSRKKKNDIGAVLASSHTLGRLELGNRELKKQSRYQKITCDYDKAVISFQERD